MKDLSRRGFFREFASEIADRLDLNAANALLEKASPSKRPKQAVSWIEVGRMADFVPGMKREITVGDRTMTLRSHADGLWVERATGERAALRMEPGGVVLVHVGIHWPANRMLSHLTGQPIDAESRDETGTTGESE